MSANIYQPKPSQFMPIGVVQPVTPTYQPQMQNNNNPQSQPSKGPNIWYRPISQQDYPKLAEIGTATIVVRFLPGFNHQAIYESICEKNNSFSKFPNSKQWLVPVLVISDVLHPEKNGFVGVMQVSKTLYGRIKNKSTPQYYYDFNNGHNFHINVSLQQSKDGSQVFPNYSKSGFENNPSQCQVDYVVPKMNEGKFSDFATFMQRINNPKQQNVTMSQVQAPQVAHSAPQHQMAYNQTGYNPQQYHPAQCHAVPPSVYPAGQISPMAGPVAPAVTSSEDEFDQIFNN